MRNGFASPRWALAAVLATASALLAGCASGPPPAPVASNDTSGNMMSGTSSSITVTNTSYDRALECVGATARLHKADAAGAADLNEIGALGAAWSANAIELGARRGASQAQVISAAGAVGGRMTAQAAGQVWAGCKSGK